jgi:hypothetical protein
MLHGLLRSAGIDAVVENVASAGLNLDVLGGARVLVHAEDAERASEICKASGAFSGRVNDREEIPDEEWFRSEPEKVEPSGADIADGEAPSPWTRGDLFLGQVLLRLLNAILRLFR